MTNITVYPLQDGYETELSEAYTSGGASFKVKTAPSFTFPSSVKTYATINPGKDIMEVFEVSAISGTTFTVDTSNISQGASVTTSGQTHPVGSKVIISDNYQFWKNIVDSVNTKIDGRVQGVYFYADATARDADLGASPATSGLIAGLTTEGKITYSLGGSWQDWSTTSSTFVNATEIVAGKGEIPTQTESDNGTAIGGTGASLLMTPETTGKSIQKQSYTYDEDTGVADAYVITLSPAPTGYTEGMKISVKVGAGNTNTGASTININGLGATAIKDRDGDDLSAGQLIQGQVYDLQYDGTNFVLLTIEKASNSDITTGTDDVKYVTPKGVKDNYVINTNAGDITETIELNRSDILTGTLDGSGQATNTIDLGIAHATYKRALFTVGVVWDGAGAADYPMLTGTGMVMLDANDDAGGTIEKGTNMTYIAGETDNKDIIDQGAGTSQGIVRFVSDAANNDEIKVTLNKGTTNWELIIYVRDGLLTGGSAAYSTNYVFNAKFYQI